MQEKFFMDELKHSIRDAVKLESEHNFDVNSVLVSVLM